MKTRNTRIASALLAVGLMAAPAALIAQGPPPPPPPQQGYGPGYAPGYGPGYAPGYGQGPGGWDAPPRDFTRDIQRQGFRDGMYGAQKDFENHRRPSVMNRDEFRNYRGPGRRLYRQAFERGYSVWWSHQGGPRPY